MAKPRFRVLLVCALLLLVLAIALGDKEHDDGNKDRDDPDWLKNPQEPEEPRDPIRPKEPREPEDPEDRKEDPKRPREPKRPKDPKKPKEPKIRKPKKVRCRPRKIYPYCSGIRFQCPASCPRACHVDCVKCSPVCTCDKPGGVCQDPRFVGGDGITFYFHGKKDRDFCLLSDSDLHINAHFIGKRDPAMTRDFTWVQSIAILYDDHRLYLGAQKTATWDDSVDRLAISYDDETISLPTIDGASWHSSGTSVVRTSDANSVTVEVEGKFKITATVVPITEEESRVHNYGIAADDCYAHLELGFKFYSLSDDVHGVLGQTYRAGYVSRVKISAAMPIMGGHDKFSSSGLYAADCAVSRFGGGAAVGNGVFGSELDEVKCASGMSGAGIVCKK